MDDLKDGGWRAKSMDEDSTRRFFTDAAVTELNASAHAAAMRSEGPLWLVQYFAPYASELGPWTSDLHGEGTEP